MEHLLDLLSKEEKQLVIIKEFQKDEIIFHENDKCEHLGIVIDGLVTITSYSYLGDEIIYNSLIKGQVFGSNLIFTNEPFYRGNVIAKKRSKVALVNKKNLIYLLRHNESFLIKYNEINSEFTKSLNAKIKLLSFTSAEERFMYYLFLHHNQINAKSITSLAHELVLSREATSRLISSLIKRNVIIRKDKIIYKVN